MVRQRSKYELLNNRLTYENVLKDERNGKELRGKASIWRNDIEWCTTLMKEKESAQFIIDFLNHIKSFDIIEIPKETVDECNALLQSLKINFVWFNCHKNSGKKDRISKSVDYLIWYNTQMSVNYGAIACLYLHQHGYGQKRMARMISNVLFMEDCFDADVMFNLRHDLYKRKGIFLSLDIDEDTPEHEWSRKDTLM